MYEAVLKSKFCFLFLYYMMLCNLETLITPKEHEPISIILFIFISMQRVSITFSHNRIKQHLMALLLKNTIA